MYIDPNFDNEAYYKANDAFANDAAGKSRGIAALLAIFLGSLGIQYFYLGKNTPGVVFLLVTVLSLGIVGTVISIISLIQGIAMFCIDNRSFDQKYVYTTNTFPLF